MAREVEIILDKPRKFKLSFKAYRQIEKVTGNTLKQIQDNPELGENMDTTLAMIWAGLLHAYPDITLEEVEDILDNMSMQEIEAQLQKALQETFEDMETTGKTRSPKAGNGKK
jgi:hypothetical protein